MSGDEVNTACAVLDRVGGPGQTQMTLPESKKPTPPSLMHALIPVVGLMGSLHHSSQIDGEAHIPLLLSS